MASHSSDKDLSYMRHALSLARRGVGYTAPNPSVGCVIVKDDVIVGRGTTGQGGRPHAESLALKAAAEQARGADVYVTLEPCSHHGQTPPCAQSLIDAGVRRVVIACGDPDPRVLGRGVQMLQDAGIEVVQKMCEHEAQNVNAGFISRITRKRPFITVKLATSWDGKTALANGQSKWITGDLARRHGHLQRARHDAILTGVGTVLADDPSLTTRLDGISRKSTRIVLDANLKTPLSSALVSFAREAPLLIFHTQGDAKPFEDAGVQTHLCDPHDLNAVLELLAEQGITRLFVEGGAQVHASFLNAGLWDEILWYRAPKLMGADAKDAVLEREYTDMSQISGLKHKETRKIGKDLLDIFLKEE